jgi:cysteine-S-conjugate beta-lyase
MHDQTRVTTLGRDPHAHHGIVNPPVYHASTILFPTLAALRRAAHRDGYYYGRYGTPTTRALAEAVAGIEGGDFAFVVSSGKTAITTVLLGLTKPAITSSSPTAPISRPATSPTACSPLRRRDDLLRPRIGAGIAELIRPNTRLVFTESPGSLTFEVQDIPAIAAAAHAKGVPVVMDNTWATGLYFKPFAHGVDVSIQAATKYIGGHSDVMMGTITTTEALREPIQAAFNELAGAPGPDDCYLALRGLRTMATRLAQHQRAPSSRRVAGGSGRRSRPCSIRRCRKLPRPRALAPRLHRQLRALRLSPAAGERPALAAMLDHLELFGMGYSWGGYESLLIPTNPRPIRTASPGRTTASSCASMSGSSTPTT